MKLTHEQFQALELWILAKIEYAKSARGPWDKDFENGYKYRAYELLVEDKEPDANQ